MRVEIFGGELRHFQEVNPTPEQNLEVDEKREDNRQDNARISHAQALPHLFSRSRGKVALVGGSVQEPVPQNNGGQTGQRAQKKKTRHTQYPTESRLGRHSRLGHGLDGQGGRGAKRVG